MSYVYMVNFEGTGDLVKIGITTNPTRRFKQLSKEYGKATNKTLLIYTPNNYKQLEKLLHASLSEYKTDILGGGGTEFFTKNCKQKALNLIKSVTDLEENAETLSLVEFRKKEQIIKRKRNNMSLNLSSETTGSTINTLNLSKIQKGERINLSKEQPSLKKVLMKLCWESSEDVDATVVMLNSQGKAVRPDWSGMVGYGNLKAHGIEHSGDLRSGGTEEVVIDLDKVEHGVESLIFIATTHEEQAPATTFGNVRNAKVYLINADTNQALYEFDLEEDHSTSTAVEMARLYKKANEWRFTSLEESVGKHHMGLQNIVDKYFQ